MDAEVTKKAKATVTVAEDKEKLPPPPFVSLQLLKEYGQLMRSHQGKRLMMVNEGSSTSSSSSSSGSKVVMSTNDIMRIARSALSKFTSRQSDVISSLINLSFDVDYSAMSSETNEDLKLAVLLHASALKVHNQEFDCARKLLNICKTLSSPITQNPVKKTVFYFSEALEKRITEESGIVIPSENLDDENPENRVMAAAAMEEVLRIFQPAMGICEQELPFCRICQYTAIQSILDNVTSARRIHIIDLGIGTGSHWSVLMHGLQALAAGRRSTGCPLEMLKLTAIATSKEIIENVGNHLSSFADAMKIPFQFKPLVSEMKNLRQDMFETEADEAIVVHSQMLLSCLLAWPDRLQSLLQTIADLHPSVMVTSELEADTNASDFLERFNETVSLTSALLDFLEDGLDKESPCRAKVEEVLIKEGIRNIIIAEGEDRIYRHHRIGIWRTFMARLGLVELPLSSYALNVARLLVNSNPRWRACTLESDGNCLIVGWKGSPVKSISVWKYRNS